MYDIIHNSYPTQTRRHSGLPPRTQSKHSDSAVNALYLSVTDTYSQGEHGRVAAVPRTSVKGLFSEPRRGDDSCGRASQARPQELFPTARGSYMPFSVEYPYCLGFLETKTASYTLRHTGVRIVFREKLTFNPH